MSISIPKLPDVPKPDSKGKYDEGKMLEYQAAMANRTMVIQTLQHTQNQEEIAASNMEKSKHDAMMAIINNVKA